MPLLICGSAFHYYRVLLLIHSLNRFERKIGKSRLHIPVLQCDGIVQRCSEAKMGEAMAVKLLASSSAHCYSLFRVTERAAVQQELYRLSFPDNLPLPNLSDSQLNDRLRQGTRSFPQP